MKFIDNTLPFASGSSSSSASIEPDYQPAYDAWKAAPTPKTRSALLKSVQPVVDTAVYSYAGKGASPAIRSRAKLLAMKSFDSYDPTKGNMKTHLLSQLRTLQREAAQSNQIIRIPERVALDRITMMNAEDALTDRLGRPPSDLEIADHTGMSLKRLAHVRQAKSGVNTGSILDAEGEVYSPPSQSLGNEIDPWKEMVYYSLGGIDRTIFDYTFGTHGREPLDNATLAKKLGVTPGAVSQRKNKIQGLLDEKHTISPFKEGV